MDDSTRHMDEQEDVDEEELRRRYFERLSDWSEPDAIKISRGGKLLDPRNVPDQDELRKQTPEEIEPVSN